MDRRRYLAALVTAPIVGIAGCAGDDGSADTTASETATTTETATPTDTATPTRSPTPTDTTTEVDPGMETATDSQTATTTATPTTTDTATATPSQSQTVEVAPGSFRFDPRSFEIGVGGTVEWVWRADGHNIVVDSQPAESDWSGTPGDGLYDEGYTHEYTFEVPGTYEYYCAPHQGLGMVGSFEVI